MNHLEALEALKQGKRVKVDRPESRQFFQMFQGDVILALLPVGACCAEFRWRWEPETYSEWIYYAKFDKWVIYGE